MSDKMWHRRHHDFESFDRIEIEAVPRYKTSGMSGDEWRVSARVRFFFKGEVVHETSFTTMKYAVTFLLQEWMKSTCPIPERVIALEREGRCDQVGCKELAVSRYKFKELFSERGERLHPEESHAGRDSYAQFCARHLRRGDCGREDADRNYEVISGPGPDESRNVIESPSGYAGAIHLSLED